MVQHIIHTLWRSYQINTSINSIFRQWIVVNNNEENLWWELYHQAVFRYALSIAYLTAPTTRIRTIHLSKEISFVYSSFTGTYFVGAYKVKTSYDTIVPANNEHRTQLDRNSSNCSPQILTANRVTKRCYNGITLLRIRLNWFEHENKLSEPIVIPIVITHL